MSTTNTKHSMRRLLLIFAAICLTGGTIRAQPATRATDTTRSETQVRDRQPILIDTLSRLLIYPEVARSVGLEGSVTIRALIGRDGQVWRKQIVKSSNAIFEKPAMEVMQKLRYLPAISNGEPVQAWIDQKITYSLGNYR